MTIDNQRVCRWMRSISSSSAILSMVRFVLNCSASRSSSRFDSPILGVDSMTGGGGMINAPVRCFAVSGITGLGSKLFSKNWISRLLCSIAKLISRSFWLVILSSSLACSAYLADSFAEKFAADIAKRNSVTFLLACAMASLCCFSIFCNRFLVSIALLLIKPTINASDRKLKYFTNGL